MKQPLSRADKDLEAIYLRHADMVYRLCYSYMKNKWDAEDAVQTAFLKLMASGKSFEDETHEKAWLIVTAGNVCKNLLKNPQRRMADIASLPLEAEETPPDETLKALLALPDRYKSALYLYYYEGYPTRQIAALLRRPASTIRNHLKEARALLKDRLLEEDHEE
ncbi:MAG: RNA polymerase sigma factor [Clostridiales bacterium]|nr:RNA polymerase sigma factor [Clostridiales bacterium]